MASATQIRWRGFAVAALLGLLPAVVDLTSQLVWPSGSAPHAVTRATAALMIPAEPGVLVGRLVIGTLDGYGLVETGWPLRPNDKHPIGWRMAMQIEDVAKAVGNMAIYGALWLMLKDSRSGSRRPRVAKVAIGCWLLFAVPAGLFVAWWMALAP